RGLPLIDTIAQDVRYALRQMRKAPGFAAVAIVSLALGIGATTSMFSLIYAVLLHPVPYAEWQRFAYPIMLNEDQPTSPERWFSVTWSQFQQIRKAKTIEDAVGTDNKTSEITGNNVPEDVTLSYVTENIGNFLGVRPLLGRNIQPSDSEVAGQQAPIVLSYSFWMRHYDGERDILGDVLEVGHKPFIIVGVMPKDYTWEPDLYVPMSLLPTRERNVVPAMKLKPGVSLAQANSEIGILVHQFAQETPQYFPHRFRLHLEGVTGRVIENGGRALVLLGTAVLMLLLIGCANCSILLLARSMNRQSELAVRSALGASRRRIVGQLLVEALVLAITGSILGIGLAYYMARLIFSLFPDVFMHESVIRINLPVLAFSIALAVVSGLFFGLLPALRMSRPDMAKAMQAAGRKVAGRIGHGRSLNTLIAAQAALTVVLMGAAGAAIVGFLRMTHQNFGYHPSHVMFVTIPMHPNSYLTQGSRATYIEALRQKIATVPGVTQVAVSDAATPPNTGFNLRFEILGSPFAQQQYLRAGFIDSQFFSVLRIPLLKGRFWNQSENQRGAAVAVINQTLARRYFPNGNAIGQQIRMPTLTTQVGDPGQVVGVPDTNGWLQIVGVVADSVNDGLDKPVLPAIYVPFARFMWIGAQFLVRTQGPPLASLHSVQLAIHSVNSDQQTLRGALDLRGWIERQPEFQRQRLFSILFGLFSGLALVLALVGLYSVVSYSVAQRTNEFGIRMALGAQRGHVLWIVVRSVGATVLSGLAAGLVLYLALHKLLVHWMQNSYSSPLVLGIAATLFLVCAAIACTVPALSAVNIDPMQALRVE
ncbi:MAG TPA: ABC transporter permease, partial [Acidobacteriaceae bacterium]|nr:ABC transporter permease [Acidobacteriaceae bacterium]